MAKKTLNRRGTGMPDSDVAELVTQHNAGSSYWVVNAALAITTTTYSIASAFLVLATNGTARFFTAVATGPSFSGITIATGNVAIVAAYVTQAGTHGVAAAATAASFGVAPLPTVPATAIAYGVIYIRASNASGFTGGATELDGTNASARFCALNGPAGMAFSTAAITVVPG